MTLSVSGGRVVSPSGTGPVRGASMSELDDRSDLAVVCEGDRIAELSESVTNGSVTFDASGCTVVPGFVDCHTHIPFFGWRADEDAARLSGIRYETLHRQEGGIYRSRKLLAEASDEDVIKFGVEQANSMLRRGTTTFEMKSGYGLSVEAELRQLNLAHAIGERVPQTTVATCLAAHAVPPGYTEGQWVGEAAEKLLPEAAKSCVAVDIFVETIAFALEHAARLAEKAKELGLVMRMHADQLENGQAAAFAARWGFRSADHLNHTSLDAIDDIAGSDTAAVLLPGATFTLKQAKKPLARDLIDAGAIVAVGSDFNPGTSPISSMQMVMALACRTYGLHPAEALTAATANGAYVLGLNHEVGRIREGMRADLVILGASSFDHLTYRPDADLILAVICGGEIAYLNARAEGRLLQR